MASVKHMPERMCICCRTRSEKSALLRIVKQHNVPIVDISGRLPGRGAYICNEAKCVEKAEKKRQLNRALKCEIPEQIYNQLLLIIDGGDGNDS